jgi:FAD/FMN-containing dehydrogenase
MDLACRVTGNGWPLASRHPVMLLLEVVDGGDASGFVGIDDMDVAVGIDATERARLWAYRESQGEAFSSMGITHKLDVSVPLPCLAQCANDLRDAVSAYPGVTHFGVFGHLADGNIHVEIVGPAPEDEAVDLAVFEIMAKYSGSISAEHGVGRAKAHHLGMSRSTAEIAAMRAIKAAWDPQGLMNPGVLLA